MLCCRIASAENRFPLFGRDALLSHRLCRKPVPTFRARCFVVASPLPKTGSHFSGAMLCCRIASAENRFPLLGRDALLSHRTCRKPVPTFRARCFNALTSRRAESACAYWPADWQNRHPPGPPLPPPWPITEPDRRNAAIRDALIGPARSRNASD